MISISNRSPLKLPSFNFFLTFSHSCTRFRPHFAPNMSARVNGSVRVCAFISLSLPPLSLSLSLSLSFFLSPTQQVVLLSRSRQHQLPYLRFANVYLYTIVCMYMLDRVPVLFVPQGNIKIHFLLEYSTISQLHNQHHRNHLTHCF